MHGRNTQPLHWLTCVGDVATKLYRYGSTTRLLRKRLYSTAIHQCRTSSTLLSLSQRSTPTESHAHLLYSTGTAAEFGSFWDASLIEDPNTGWGPCYRYGRTWVVAHAPSTETQLDPVTARSKAVAAACPFKPAGGAALSAFIGEWRLVRPKRQPKLRRRSPPARPHATGGRSARGDHSPLTTALRDLRDSEYCIGKQGPPLRIEFRAVLSRSSPFKTRRSGADGGGEEKKMVCNCKDRAVWKSSHQRLISFVSSSKILVYVEVNKAKIHVKICFRPMPQFYLLSTYIGFILRLV